MVEQVKDVISSALIKISKESNINLGIIRLEIKIEDDEVVIKQLHKSTYYPSEKENISWGKILGMKSIFSSVIKSTIKKNLIRLAIEDGISENDISCRFYMDSEKKCNSYLFNNGTPLKKIELSDIV